LSIVSDAAREQDLSIILCRAIEFSLLVSLCLPDQGPRRPVFDTIHIQPRKIHFLFPAATLCPQLPPSIFRTVAGEQEADSYMGRAREGNSPGGKGDRIT
jgi:hypothetical protein